MNSFKRDALQDPGSTGQKEGEAALTRRKS